MPRRVCPSFWIVADVSIGIHPTGVGLRGVSSREAATQWVIVAEVVVEQSGLAVQALSGEVVGGGHRALAVAYRTVGREELHRLGGTCTIECHCAAAQRISEQIGKRTTGAHRHALAVGTVVLGGGGRAASNHRLGITIKGDGVSDRRAVALLQHAVAFVIVEETIGRAGATGRRPLGEPPFHIIAHQRPGGAAPASVPAGRVSVAAGHVAHVVIGGVLVGMHFTSVSA